MGFDGLKQKNKVSHALFASFYSEQLIDLKKKKVSYYNGKSTGLGMVSQVFNPDFLLCP